jgi:hypothetical protein
VRVRVGSWVTDTVVQHAVDETAALLPPELGGFRPAVEGGARRCWARVSRRY